MAVLADMEELITIVPERETADYLRQAFVCYGAGAYRARIVLTHIALFEGLRAKLHAVTPVKKAARWGNGPAAGVGDQSGRPSE